MTYFPPSSIAIVGLAGRFPDAPDLQAFWRNLAQGVESLVTFSDEELLEAGIPAEVLSNENYVKKGTLLERAEFFDADFFGYNPREAEIIDPQQRIFLECAWEALEDAGYAGEPRSEVIGVYAGSTSSSYVYANLLRNPSVLAATSGYQVMIANDKDYLATRVSYKLNLKGPSITIQTACSTSLAAVQTACAAILGGQCDMALGGGVSVGFPQKAGHLYTEGMIFSPDGHCRPFDAQGRGIRAGFGAGIVVLKRLDKALEDGDSIRAVIRGAAMNNDGGVKMGYTTPSVEGQAGAIAEALRIAQVDPDSVSYIEAHGTATPVGDPIEIAALNRVFRASTDKKQFCAIGSVKGNIGHLDAAAGVAGLIKTVLALENKRIPPSVNFSEPNPEIDFENSPFFVNVSLTEWESMGKPRRAGVSSFGIGGTNVHVVLEQAPPRLDPKINWPSQLLVLSGKSAAALNAATAHLAEHLAANPSITLADACYTLQVGRKRFPHRRMLVCSDREGAIELLSGSRGQSLLTTFEEAASPPVVFMFSGQGSQHAGMARGLYDCQPVFRSMVDECAALLHDEIHCDLRDILYGPEASHSSLIETRFAQPALFAIEYSLARLWMSWGVQPETMIGHSIGEYVAACLAGVFSLGDGLRLVAARGRLMQAMPAGGMLAVRLSPEELQTYISGDPDLSLAAVNAPRMCTVSGPLAAMKAIQSSLEARGVDCRPLHTSHAFHSSMMDEMLSEYGEYLRNCRLSAPKIPFVSNVTGRRILPEQATDVSYWTRHLRQTVRFADGMRELASDPSRLFLEVGPGQALTALARECLHDIRPSQILGSLPHPQDPKTDTDHILSAVGKLWLSGVPIDWDGFHQNESLHRVPLPTYPFESQRYWVAPESNGIMPAQPTFTARQEGKAEFNDWFYFPSWRRSFLPTVPESSESYGPWLIFADESELGNSAIEALAGRDERIVTVRQGASFSRPGDREYIICPSRAEDYRALLNQIATGGFTPRSVLYLWSLASAAGGSGRVGFRNLWLLAEALGDRPHSTPIECIVVSSGMHAVSGSEAVDPEVSLLLGPCKVIPREYPQIRCRSIDLLAADSASSTIEGLLLEPGMPRASRAIAYRGGYRWEQSYERGWLPARVAKTVRQRGVYLITGGMGGIGLTLAAHLAETRHGRIALAARTPLPDRSLWPEWLQTHDGDDDTCRRIRQVERIEALGGDVLPVVADVCDQASMQQAIRQVRDHFGPINGVIHAAGIVEPGLLQLKTQAAADRVLAPKVDGTLILDSLLKDEPLDFLVLCSSINAICGVAGSIDYTAGNCFLDAFAASRFHGSQAKVVSINWDAWREVGMAFKRRPGSDQPEWKDREYEEIAITPGEGVAAFERILASGLPQVAVIPRDLDRLLEESETSLASLASPAASTPAAEKQNRDQALHSRPDLASVYVAPETEFERLMAEIWSESLGIREVGIDDNFFELGGHSLLAIAVLSQARTTFGVALPLRVIFDRPTVRLLSEQLETLLWATSRPALSGDELEQREEIEL
jgi:acyl transferase domain-containing protein